MALLKARQLMAEHKLTEHELQDVSKQRVKEIQTKITCSKRRNPWIVSLSATIGENYCCKGVRGHLKGKQTQSISFLGFEEDAEICKEIFEYAVDCAVSKILDMQTEYALKGIPKDITRKYCDSFGYGFVVGIEKAFEKQQEENYDEWGLVLVMPKEVEAAAESIGHADFDAIAEQRIENTPFSMGMEHGKNFTPNRRLKEQYV